MFNINEYIATALFNVLSEPTHADDLLSHCAAMPQLKLLEVLSTPFNFKGQPQVNYGDNFYGEGSMESMLDGISQM